jgi:hypothetical protein
VDSVSQDTSTNSYTFTGVIANHAISATFTNVGTNTITSTYNGGPGMTTPYPSVDVTYGSNQTFTFTADPDHPGYHVVNVVVDGVSVGAVTSYTFYNVTASHTIDGWFDWQNFTPYTITASAGGGGYINPPGAVTVYTGRGATFTATANVSGYHLARILVDSVSQDTSTGTYAFTNVTANHTIAAYFATTVSASVSGGNGTALPASQDVIYNDTGIITIIPDTGYHITGITDNSISQTIANPYYSTNVITAHTVVVTFGSDTISVSVSPGSWNVGSIAVGSVYESSAFTATNAGNVPEDFKIKSTNGANGWTIGGSPGSNTFKVAADAYPYATYDITLSASDISLASGIALSGTQDFKLQYSAPTPDNQGGGTSHDFTITITASKTP